MVLHEIMNILLFNATLKKVRNETRYRDVSEVLLKRNYLAEEFLHNF
jgi:hypothetical protein